MVELTPELIEQLANEEVIAMESGPESMNRVTLTTESGHVIVADIIGISSAAERLEAIDAEIARMEAERNTLQATVTLKITEANVKPMS